MNKRQILLFTLLFVATNLSAQLGVDLKQVVINPAQININPKKSGRSYTVINSEDIEKMAATSVEDLLSNIEGVNINARGGFGTQADVGMRGSTFAQVLILIDNVRVNEPLTGHYNMYLPIALAEIDRIEVVRGPAASAYGADAVGGVIHIKTKNYTAKRYSKSKQISSTGSVLVGENRLRLIDALVEKKNKDVYFGGSVNVKTSIGQVFENPNIQRDSTLDKTYRTNLDIKNYSLFGNYFLSDKTKLFARASLNTRDFGAKYFYTNSTYDQSVEKINTIWSQIGMLHESKNSETQIGVAYKKLTDEFIFNPLFSKNNHTTRSIIANLQQERKVGGRLRAAYGLQSIFQEIRSTDRGDHKNNTHAAFASLSYELGKKMTLNGSARLEDNSNYGMLFTPQLGLAYRATSNLVLRSNIGRANRAPDFTERYISNNLSSLSAGRNLGNPNLKSEQSTTADIGLDYFNKNEKLVTLSVFGRKGTDLIDYILTNSDVINTSVQLAPQEDYFYSQNVSEATTYGLEVGLQKRIKLGEASALKVNANYTYSKTETANNEPSKYISNHPGHMANLQLAYEAQFMDLVMTTNFRTRKQEENVAVFGLIPERYFVSNAVVRLKTLKGRLNFTGKVLNIFDTSYQEILGAPMPQRWFAAGIDWKF